VRQGWATQGKTSLSREGKATESELDKDREQKKRTYPLKMRQQGKVSKARTGDTGKVQTS
jgi:hypothetical protein